MSKVFFDISMSLDGFMTAAGQTSEGPSAVAATSLGGDPCCRSVWRHAGARLRRSFAVR